LFTKEIAAEAAIP